MTALLHLDEATLSALHEAVPQNVDRYRGKGFAEYANEPGWRLPVEGVRPDLDALAALDGTTRSAEADLANSRIVREALKELTPSLANEDRLWTRLAHIECFEYSVARWLDTDPEVPDEAVAKAAELHFFAGRQTQVRDDHAISRLWWNGFIAGKCYPDDPDHGLELLLRSADIRQNLIERPWLVSRPKIASGIFRKMERSPEIAGTLENFRVFMKSLNLRGGGVVFEAMTESEIDRFMDDCAEGLPSGGDERA